jgi:hypothetical protein
VSEELNRDPLVQKLARLTPSSSAVDRDALLFAAGRASAPKTRGWKLLSVVLAVSQAATLALWIAASGLGTPRTEIPRTIGPEEVSPGLLESPVPQPASAETYASLSRQLEKGGLPKPEPFADPLPAHPTWSADLRSLENSFE